MNHSTQTMSSEGHNLNLHHSGEGVNEYDDQSGLMVCIVAAVKTETPKAQAYSSLAHTTSFLFAVGVFIRFGRHP